MTGAKLADLLATVALCVFFLSVAAVRVTYHIQNGKTDRAALEKGISPWQERRSDNSGD